MKEIYNKSKTTYSLAASKFVMNWYQGKEKVTKVKPGKLVVSKGKRFKISYASELLKSIRLRLMESFQHPIDMEKNLKCLKR